MRTAIVVGGGIGGLASGLALARRGWRTTVLERADDHGEVGAGVAIPGNGITALRALGLDDEAIDSLGTRTVGTGFQDLHGRWVLRIPDERPEIAKVIGVWGVHRRRLHEVLRRAALDAGVTLLSGHRVVDVTPGSPGGARAVVRADRGGAWEADLVVGADGMWSAVRTALFPSASPVYSGSTSWRAVVDDTSSDDRLIEMWGPGAEFGAMRISPTQLYWYGYVRSARSVRFDDELAAARARFDGWADPVPSLLRATDPDRLMRHDVFRLPGGLPSYVRGRVVLVGDAAHAALPTMGQGAATALEDAATLGRLVGLGNLADGLRAFDESRRPRCRSIARQAATMARIGADVGGGWRQTLRNTLFRAIPGGALARSGARLVAWEPPALR